MRAGAIHSNILRLAPANARRGLALLLAAAVALLGACAGGADGAPRPGGEGRVRPQRTTSAEHDAYAALGYRLAWRGYPILSRGAEITQIHLLGDAVSIHGSGNSVTVMDASSGVNRWSSALASPLTRFVGHLRDDDALLVASDTELFILDIATGEIRDRHDLAIVVNTQPVQVGSIVIFGSGTGEVLGHNLVSGFKQWGYRLDGSIDAPPARLGVGLAGVVSQNGDVIVIDPATGSSTFRDEIFDGLENAPVAGEDAFYVASRDRSVYAFPARGERRLWRHRTESPLRDQPALIGDVLYTTAPEAGLLALDAADGSLRWTVGDVHGRVVGVRDDRLIVWDRDAQSAAVLDPDTGDVLERVDLPGAVFMRMTKPVEGELFVTDRTGAVSKFVPRS